MSYTEANRALKITTPLGKDKLLLRAVSSQEAISQLFRFQLDFLSEDDSIAFDSIVGQRVTIHLEIVDGVRHWDGFVSRFSQGARDEQFASYRAEMVPWLWFLTRKADCRIFQKKTAPEIIQQVFKDLGFQDYKLSLCKTYRTREYCVQYRETSFNFVSRLMEEEGIFYFFQHSDGVHTMILADDPSVPTPCPGQASARCEITTGGWHPDDVISAWQSEQEFRPTAWAHTDYNFEIPKADLLVKVQKKPKWEMYDYPGLYLQRGDGDKLAKVRLEETTTPEKRASGKSNCRCFTSGYTVDVTEHYRGDVNQKWLLTAVSHHVSMGTTYSTGGGGSGMHYENSFECIPATVPFRPARRTPKPQVQGCQTAEVVGKKGEEIYTDKYGRVKVQFHWDREHHWDENSSCWLRVGYPWAGKSWGGIHIPRIGQEVIVDFLEGDPDQPIITGRVYNAENMPPWKLDDKKVISGFRSDSTKGGGGYNELSMDDTKGNELIQIHAQFDQAIKVEHDERTDVGNNRTESVGNDEKITIGNNRTEDIGNVLMITAGTKITLQTGASKIVMQSSGDIEISGVNIKVEGSATIKEEAALINSEASAINTIKGGLVKIN